MPQRFEGKRIRDPVHGLIVFEENNERDALAWQLLNTPEMQRLRRIRQLGVSEFVYPGATHSRFAHSIGVYHTAKQLVEIIKRELERLGREDEYDEDAADDAILAALLHDIGHGPFSHAFENVQKDIGRGRKHELWSADIILNPNGKIFPLLAENLGERRAEHIAAMLKADDPQDIYHAVFSSSFDADRLDYLQRDRMMTGTGAGAIDFAWLINNLRIAPVTVFDPSAAKKKRTVETFCFDGKARAAAEQFLYSRYTLHEQVYFHKVTRCVEKMLSALLQKVAANVKEGKPTGLPETHPLVQFYALSNDKAFDVRAYLKLDDLTILGALPLIADAPDKGISNLARRLLERDLYKTLDLEEVREEHREEAENWIDETYAEQRSAGEIVKDDDAKIVIYKPQGESARKNHKKLHVLDGDQVKEISKVSPLVAALQQQKAFTRYFFADAALRDSVRERITATGEGS